MAVRFAGMVAAAAALSALLWFAGRPMVFLHYAADAAHPIEYIFDIDGRIFKGELAPGEDTRIASDMFADDDFILRVDWSVPVTGAQGCLNVLRRLHFTRIHLDAAGRPDLSRTRGVAVSDC